MMKRFLTGGRLRAMAALLVFGIAAGAAGKSHAQQTYTYQVTVSTANVAYAGTNARVYITLYGPKGPPDGVKLELDSVHDDFEPGSVRTYPISTTIDIGGVSAIKIEHDNSAPFPMWHPVGIEVVDPKGESVQFNVNRWLSVESGDRQIEFTMQRADYDTWINQKTVEQFTSPIGQWKVACGGGQNCEAQLERALEYGGSQTETVTSDFLSSLTVALNSEFKVAGLGVDTTVTAGVSYGREEALSIVARHKEGKRESCGTKVDMVTYDIHRVWQWTIASSFAGKPVTLKTCEIACTSGVKPPIAKPYQPAAVGTCLIPRGTTTSATRSGVSGATSVSGVGYGANLHVGNKYNNWGTFLDVNGGGCEGNKLCVSASTSSARDGASGKWRIIPAGGATLTNGSPIRFGDEIHVENLYGGGNSYLDVNRGGCEGNELCVSASSTPTRDGPSGTWRIVSATGKAAGTPVEAGDEFHVQNKYNNWRTYLDVNGGGCEGNALCVSAATSPTRDGPSGTWRFQAAP